jgi:plastocyanin
MNKTLIIIIAIVVVGFAIYFLVPKSNSVIAPVVPTMTTQTSTAPAPATISINNFAFNPSTLIIKVGTRVTWTNNDNVSHTITSDSGNLLKSPTLTPGQSFSFTFTKAGSENYHCSIHPSMTGQIAVQN